MNLARLLRLLPAFLLAGALVGPWTSAPLAAGPGTAPDPALDQMERLLEAKKHASLIQRRADEIAPRLPHAGLRAKALAISYEAKLFFDRAEKQFQGR